MTMPLQQKIAVAKYIAGKKIKGEKKYPLVLELEPLLQCNLACAGCGKISHPDDILRKRLSIEECIAAVEECGAPMVSIAGGEPLVHDQMPQIVEELVKRKKFVFLCTNALLLKKKIHLFKPSVYFVWMIHLDGMRERHDQSVCREGVSRKRSMRSKKRSHAASVSLRTRRSSIKTGRKRFVKYSTTSTTT